MINNNLVNNSSEGLVSCGQTSIFYRALSLILQAIAPCKKIEVWPRETSEGSVPVAARGWCMAPWCTLLATSRNRPRNGITASEAVKI